MKLIRRITPSAQSDDGSIRISDEPSAQSDNGSIWISDEPSDQSDG